MKARIGPARTRKQFEDKLAKLDAKIAALLAGVAPYQREREMVVEMLEVHDRHHPVAEVASADGAEPARQPAGEPSAGGDEALPSMLKRRQS